jgi:hypothetical protein
LFIRSVAEGPAVSLGPHANLEDAEDAGQKMRDRKMREDAGQKMRDRRNNPQMDVDGAGAKPD